MSEFWVIGKPTPLEVEVDLGTGGVEPIGLWVANDVGFILNPLTAEGQVHREVVQGIG